MGKLAGWKREFIEFCFEKGVLKVATGDNKWTLKSGRKSWWFFNAGAFDNGEALEKEGNAYANTILDGGITADTLYGPAYKGIPIAVAVSMVLHAKGKTVGYTFDRKEEKLHGEATGANRAKKMFVGMRPYPGMKVIIIDDVVTNGASKDECAAKMNSVADVKYVACIVMCDRQEKNDEGVLTSEAMAKKYGRFMAVINASDVVKYLVEEGKMTPELKVEIVDYNNKHGAYDLSCMKA